MKKLVEKQITKAAINKIVEGDASKSKKVIALFEGGLEISEIAKLVGIRYQFAYNVTSNYVNKNRLEDQLVKEEKVNKKAEILRMYDEGISAKDIARELDTYQNYVYQVINKRSKEAIG